MTLKTTLALTAILSAFSGLPALANYGDPGQKRDSMEVTAFFFEPRPMVRVYKGKMIYVPSGRPCERVGSFVICN